jgi:hypothetical protein
LRQARDDVIDLLTIRLGEGSNSRRKIARALITGVLDEAVTAGKITIHRCGGIALPDSGGSGNHDDFVYVSHAQLLMLANGSEEPPVSGIKFPLSIWLMRGCGLRIEEALAVQKSCFRDKGTVLREAGLDVRILMADPDSPECVQRGVEERLFDAIPARVRMALSYYAPLADVPGVHFRLQSETLYNSIFVYDSEMLINQHIYGTYGYMAPILHLRRMEGADFFDMYIKSFERVWEISSPVEESDFWRQRAAAVSSASAGKASAQSR